jgi:GT2 family glycosyltransferase
VIIPTYWGGVKLARCLRTFRECHPDPKQWELVVVLDGGPDWIGTAQIAKDYGACFIGKTSNSGFAKTVNIGIRATAQCAVRILLNDDVYFQTDACSKLVGAFADPNVWVAGVRLLYPDGRVQHGGAHHDFRHCHVGKCADDPAVAVDRDIFAVTGALMGLSNELLSKIGGLDESFGLAWEDSDLCMQAHRFGKRVRYIGSTWAYHEESGTRRGGNVDWNRWESDGASHFQKKWGPKDDWPKVKLRTL